MAVPLVPAHEEEEEELNWLPLAAVPLVPAHEEDEDEDEDGEMEVWLPLLHEEEEEEELNVLPLLHEEEEEEPNWVALAQTALGELEEINATLESAASHSAATRAALIEIIELVDEDTDAAEILHDAASTLVPQGADMLPASAIDAAAKFVDGLLSGEQNLPGTIGFAKARMERVSTYMPFGPDDVGPLQMAFGVLLHLLPDHTFAVNNLEECAEHIGVHRGHVAWESWTNYRGYVFGVVAEAWDGVDKTMANGMRAKNCAEVAASYPFQSPQQGEFVQDVLQHLHSAIGAIDKTLQALAELRDAIRVQRHMGRRILGNAAPAAPPPP